MRAASGVRVPSLRGRVSGRGLPGPWRFPRAAGVRGMLLPGSSASAGRGRPAVRAALGGDAVPGVGRGGARAAPPLARPGPGARAAPGGSGRGARAAGAPGTRALAPTRSAAPGPARPRRRRPHAASRLPARARPPARGRGGDGSQGAGGGCIRPPCARVCSARLPAQPSAWGPWVSRPGRPAPTATAGRLVAVAKEKGWAVCGKWV